MANGIEPIVMPKWGLAMTEGMLNSWAVDEGSAISAGDEICEIETSKLSNMFESPVTGVLRRQVATIDEMLPVGALIAVVADAAVSDDDIAAFVSEFQANFVPEETDAGGPEPETVTVDGRKLVYLKMGDDNGTPLVLLHGFGADMNGWLFNQGDLAESAAVYALDLPGHGKSVKDVGDGSFTHLASMVAGFMREAGIDNAHMVGHSMGAGVALEMAATHADKVASLVLIGPCGLGDEINTEFLEGYISAKRQKHLKPVLQQLVTDKSLISSDMMEDVIRFKRIDGVPEGLVTLVERNYAGGRQSTSYRALLNDLVVPVTVVWGADDEIIPSAHASGLPDKVDVELIDNAGHVPQMENAARVNDIIRAAVRKTAG